MQFFKIICICALSASLCAMEQKYAPSRPLAQESKYLLWSNYKDEWIKLILYGVNCLTQYNPIKNINIDYSEQDFQSFSSGAPERWLVKSYIGTDGISIVDKLTEKVIYELEPIAYKNLKALILTEDYQLIRITSTNEVVQSDLGDIQNIYDGVLELTGDQIKYLIEGYNKHKSFSYLDQYISSVQ
ncbi:hypothetical protein J120_01610 [candidate division TM6 bacterium JCVI TM6SC1]|uniref:Uncharacterized protein n=1 Tax=candidate division TM6 bacterium JCVI TM6SC1 TaxID=1306947 RepID=A0A0D2JF07_9BACT|nr:hypothetical protein J120_01610 [candidate division TM6 bacterium JCVI TM6SC1]